MKSNSRLENVCNILERKYGEDEHLVEKTFLKSMLMKLNKILKRYFFIL